jgi:quercetin dioxygenase-like cupin family protein
MEDAPPGFECRAVTVDRGGDRVYHDREWRDALVVMARGEVELEWRDGRRQRLANGAVFWLAGLPLRRIHNCGDEAAQLVAISRRARS